MKTYVIHLDRATGRKAQVADLLALAPYPATVLPAVDGSQLGTSPVARLYEPQYPFALSPGEVGCFLSHRKAWQAILDAPGDGALILEDDVSLGPDFASGLLLAEHHLAEIGYIQFQTRNLKTPAAVVAQEGHLSLQKPEVVPLRTSAQLVHKDAARALLERSAQIDRPVDCFLQMHWETGVWPHVIVPSTVSDRTQETGGSTIKGSKKGPLEQISRSVKRHRYRAKIARLSRDR